MTMATAPHWIVLNDFIPSLPINFQVYQLLRRRSLLCTQQFIFGGTCTWGVTDFEFVSRGGAYRDALFAWWLITLRSTGWWCWWWRTGIIMHQTLRKISTKLYVSMRRRGGRRRSKPWDKQNGQSFRDILSSCSLWLAYPPCHPATPNVSLSRDDQQIASQMSCLEITWSSKHAKFRPHLHWSSW